jgi:hypothetical protein
MKILVFDKFIGYRVGGAQNSLQLLLKNLKGDFKFLGCNTKKAFSAEKFKLSEWNVERIEIKEFPRFPYFEYLYNRKRVKKFIVSQKADLLLAQGLWGAIAINAFSGKSIYFIRDSYHFNRVPIYERGFKKILKMIYIFIQSPFLHLIFSDNTKAIKKADIVMANSGEMKKRLEEFFERDADFIYPLIDVRSLVDKQIPAAQDRKFFVCMASDPWKGRKIVEDIARQMPNKKFMIVGREFNKPIWKNNILYYPWLKDTFEIYQQAKIVLNTFFDDIIPRTGRVGVEANALGIPCISSRQGKVYDFLEEKFFIDDIWDINLWKNKIEEVENNYEEYCHNLKEQALKFDAEKQIERFKEIICNKLNIQL